MLCFCQRMWYFNMFFDLLIFIVKILKVFMLFDPRDSLRPAIRSGDHSRYLNIGQF